MPARERKFNGHVRHGQVQCVTLGIRVHPGPLKQTTATLQKNNSLKCCCSNAGGLAIYYMNGTINILRENEEERNVR